MVAAAMVVNLKILQTLFFVSFVYDAKQKHFNYM